jgi:phage tail-like protein
VKEDSPADDNRVTEGHGEGVSRRDVLKMSAAAAVAAGAGAAGLSMRNTGLAAPVTAAAIQVKDFEIEIPGMPASSMACSGIEGLMAAFDTRETTTGLDVEYRTYAPGDAHYGRVKVKFPAFHGDPVGAEIMAWMEQARTTGIRKNITVIVKKTNGSPIRTFNLHDCFPVKWDPGDYSPSSTVAVETLEIAIQRVEMR